ncbi:hypothetical protein C8D88_102128 [Lentzea atacamensis]|uniref:Uncharacterized protein n=1 Tax=Lentzea atacamensis TaxID=531938 RepID=A0A316I605_9PSEU|nr:hypothetical protein [Lentzea atacamensis]PWK88862.1 hypothetical protein C8D88_102128 [Lentzea atacamensis]
MHTPRVVIWTTSDPESTRTALSRRLARPRLLVPVPHGTFVLGPDPHTSSTFLDNLRIVNGVRVGLVWTESTAWIVYFDGTVRGWRFGPDDSFEPAPPKGLPDGLSWLTDAVEAVREHGVIDGLGALRVALEAAGYPADTVAMVKIDGGEVDDAVPHHEKKWWETLLGERHGMAEAPGKPFTAGGPLKAAALQVGTALALLVVFVFFVEEGVFPDAFTLVMLVLGGLALPFAVAHGAFSVHRSRRRDPFPERDILGMSAWARAADEE